MLASGITVQNFVANRSKVAPIVIDPVVTAPSTNEVVTALEGNKEESKVPELAPISSIIQEPSEKQSTLVIGSGDTIMSVLSSIGMTREQVYSAVEALRKVYNPKALKVGQQLHVVYKKADNEAGISLISVDFKTSAGSDIALRYKNGEFNAEKFEVKLTTVQRKITGTINSSFYSAALKRGVPARIVKEAISALSYDVNWQHDPKSGDAFQIMYEVMEDPEGNVIKAGELKFAAFAPNGNWRKIYAFQTNSGTTGYFNAKGESVVKSLLQTPVDPSRMRITSKFGRRKDPTNPMQNYTKMHKGVDFGAPTGTPVMSAGDGTILKAGWNGAYGNYILVRHNAEYCTAYAHLSKIHVKQGTKVKQRQVIGAVGSTGRSTGAHLHYEVIHKGIQVNPQLLKQLPAAKLEGKEFSKFQKIKAILDNHAITDPVAQVVAQKLPFAG